MSMIRLIKKIFQRHMSAIVNYFLKIFNIFIVFRIGRAIGDQLCMSAVVRLIDEQYSFKIIVVSSFPELFDNNPRIWRNYGAKFNNFGIYASKILRFLSGERLENFLFKSDIYSIDEFMREKKNTLHLAEIHSMHFKIDINFHEISNEIFFSDQEIEEFKMKFNLPKDFSLIQPNPKTSYTPNKQWGVEKYQEVVNQVKHISWIQAGVEGDVVLDNVDSYVGKTSLRELAFLIKKAKFVLADEGLFNHLASSVGSTSVVVYSGFSSSELAKYKRTISIVNNPQVECSPCWLKEKCPKKIKFCTELISINQVINVIQEL